MSLIAKVGIFALVGFMAVVLFVPQVRSVLTSAFASSESLVVPDTPGAAPGEGDEYNIITLLGYDAIPAILDPSFVSAPDAEQWMEPDEQVLGLSINGDSRAYSIRMLSRHEIVNDTVGGEPVAVTW